MTNKEKILAYLHYIAPNRVTNGELRQQTGIASHQQVYLLTQELLRLRQIAGAQVGSEWYFWVADPIAELDEPALAANAEPGTGLRPHAAFEALAQQVMSEHYGVALAPGQVAGVPKQFDLVSADRQIVGDAKYYILVCGEGMPAAKFATIAEYVWLLEKSGAQHKFLVFGNDPNVPRWWLRKYGHLAATVAFYFLHEDGTLECMSPV